VSSDRLDSTLDQILAEVAACVHQVSAESLAHAGALIESLLKACDFCDEAGTDRRKKYTMRRETARRDRVIILTLIDSGLRASELCSLRIAD